MHGNLSVDIITSSKTVFLKLHSWKNVCLISQQIMSTDKYLGIFSCQMEIVVYKASIWPQTYACLFVLEYFLFLEAHSLPQAPLSEIIIVLFLGEIISTVKYLLIFPHQMGVTVYLHLPTSEGPEFYCRSNNFFCQSSLC